MYDMDKQQHDMDKLRKDFVKGGGGPEALEEAFKGELEFQGSLERQRDLKWERAGKDFRESCEPGLREEEPGWCLSLAYKEVHLYVTSLGHLLLCF